MERAEGYHAEHGLGIQPGLTQPPTPGDPEQRTTQVAQKQGIAGAARPGAGNPAIRVSVHPPLAGSSFPTAIDAASETMDCMSLFEIANELKMGKKLSDRQGALVVEERPRIVSDLTLLTTRSPENAKKFLGSLAQVADSEDPQVQERASKALVDFATSDWFQRVLKKNPDVADSLVRQAADVLGTPCEENRAEWTKIQESLQGSSSTEAQGLVQEWVGVLDQVGSILDYQTQWVSGLVAEAKDGGQKGASQKLSLALTQEHFQSFVKNNPEFAKLLVDQALEILGPPSEKNLADWKKIQEILQGSSAIEAMNKVQSILEEHPTGAVAETLRNVSSFVDLAPSDGMPVMVDGHKYWAKCDRSADGKTLTVHFSAWKGKHWREASCVTFESTGKIISVFEGGQGNPPDSLSPTLKGCMEAYSQRLGTMSTLKAELTEAIEAGFVKAGETKVQAKALAEQKAKELVEKWATQWKGCVSESLLPRRAFRQTSGIPGLKVMGKKGNRVAEISLSALGAGGFKKVKGVLRITPEGKVVNLVRYTETEKNEVAEAVFKADVKHERKIRKKFFWHGIGLRGEMANAHLYDSILRLDAYSSHVSRKTGKVKTRYVAEQAQGDLLRCIYEDKEGIVPRKSLEERMVAIHSCVGALRGLRLVHARGYVHRDVKLENTLTVNGRGKLTDFGLCVPKGRAVKELRGTPLYMAPELFVAGAKEDPSMDMFSFGSMLLEILDPGGLGKSLLDANDNAMRGNITPAAHKSQIEAIQRQLRDKNSLLCKQIIDKYGDKAAEVLELIAQLIDFDQKKRPTSTEAEPVLQRFEQLLPPIPA